MKNDLKNDKKKKMVGERAEQKEISKDRLHKVMRQFRDTRCSAQKSDSDRRLVNIFI